MSDSPGVLLEDPSSSVIDLEQAVRVESDKRAIRRDWEYLTLMRGMALDRVSIDDVSPDRLSGPVALALLDGQTSVLKAELHRWALYFARPIQDAEEYVKEIEAGTLRDPASISEVARITRELVDIAESLFKQAA